MCVCVCLKPCVFCCRHAIFLFLCFSFIGNQTIKQSFNDHCVISCMQKLLLTVEEMFLEAEGCHHAADWRRSAEEEEEEELKATIKSHRHTQAQTAALTPDLVMALKSPRILALCRATKAWVKMTPLLYGSISPCRRLPSRLDNS